MLPRGHGTRWAPSHARAGGWAAAQGGTRFHPCRHEAAGSYLQPRTPHTAVRNEKCGLRFFQKPSPAVHHARADRQPRVSEANAVEKAARHCLAQARWVVHAGDEKREAWPKFFTFTVKITVCYRSFQMFRVDLMPLNYRSSLSGFWGW